MEEKPVGIFTKAKELYKKISEAESHIAASVENTVYIEFAKTAIDEYYALLNDNSEAQIDLKNRFDLLANWKKKQLSNLDLQFTTTDSMNKYDLIVQKKNIERTYQSERLLECIMNYDKYNLSSNDITID